MKRPRGACKGCKCCCRTESGDYECMGSTKFRKIKQPPKVCEKRIDAATYMDEENEQ